MVVQLCPNIEMSANTQVAAEVAKNLTHQGVRCICADSLRAFFADPSGIEWISQTLADENCDYFAAIGGDGTTLRTAQRAIQQDKPIFSINTGRVGFLAAFDARFPEEINMQEIKGLKQHKRLLLDFYLKRAPDVHYYAINDVVVQRSTAASTIEICLQYGHSGMARIRSDGIIVATPTGSTAYSLSAGGPIVAPGVEAFIVTPICAHNLASRSYVLGTDNPVQISLTERADNNACITFDGVTVSEFHRDDTVVIQRGKKYLQLLTSPKRSFYGILSREISEKD